MEYQMNAHKLQSELETLERQWEELYWSHLETIKELNRLKDIIRKRDARAAGKK